ncbi:hypothetical protein ABDK00_010565 [Niabella insulamsoli]|uniref:hypothetical protein n=1 Tax=Niabella insulamsoli TaxID=3144874 RepID=UPI0031FCAC96
MVIRSCMFALLLVMIVSCGNKKKNMAGAEDVNLQEYVDFFPEVTLPFEFADSSLSSKPDDSLSISLDIFRQFTPDSSLTTGFNEKTKLYAIGKFKEDNGATYLLLKALSAKQKLMLITAYNEKNAFIAGLQAMKSRKNQGISTQVQIDKNYNINRKTLKKLSNGIEISGEDVYVLNASIKQFMLVLTDSLGDDVELFNPIDTLGRKYKYAADYGQGKRNIISIRDNAKEGRVNFFIHLEESKSDCQGELRGEAVIVSDHVVEYRRPGDPCVLQFIFSKNEVTLKEIEGCGSRMGALDCTFNGSYPKKKDKK